MLLLNQEEQNYALNHHNRVIHFLRKNNLGRETYAVIIYGYLEAVYEYLRIDRKRGNFAKKADSMMAAHLNVYINSDENITTMENNFLHESIIPNNKDGIVNLQENVEVARKLLTEIEKKEAEVLAYVLKGYSTEEICGHVDISPISVSWLISRIRSRMTALITVSE